MLHKTLLFLCTSILLFSAINSDGDFQLWLTESQTGKIRDDFAFKSEFEIRLGDDASKAFLFYGEVGFQYIPYSWLKLGVLYRQFGFRLGQSDRWEAAYSPSTYLTFSWKKNDWEISNRNWYMFFMKDPEFHPNFSLYRNLTKIVLPGSPSGKFHPFISQEFFIRQNRGFNQSRTQAGFITNFSPNFTLSTFYLLRYFEKLNGDWVHQNVLGINGKFKF